MCEQNFGQQDAAIVCRELGFSDRGLLYKSTTLNNTLHEVCFRC